MSEYLAKKFGAVNGLLLGNSLKDWLTAAIVAGAPAIALDVAQESLNLPDRIQRGVSNTLLIPK